MFVRSAIPVFLCLLSLSGIAATREPFDTGWLFLKADAPGAEQPAFQDNAWRSVRLPHDWSIEGPFDAKAPTGQGGAFLPAGTGWYRKSFSLPAKAASQRVYIDFDGVMANSDVWINGFHLGKRPNGSVSFRYELTGHLQSGKPNVLAVRVDDASQPASRWYVGAGINRHVFLVTADPVHLEHWSTFVTTPNVTADSAVVHVRGTIENQSTAARRIAAEITLLDPSGAVVKTATLPAQTVTPGTPVPFQQDVAVAKPQRWDLDTPRLYRAQVRLVEGKNTLDQETVPFGIREFHFDAATGFWLNGRNFKIKGAALHEEVGAMGTAVPVRAWERRLEQLRELGVNAIRTAHNPASPAFLDLADRMGFLVMDEMFDCWTVGKNPFDYHLYFREWSQIDERDSVRRDRNHPSIILYSAGNEIHDTPKQELAKEILASLVKVFHEEDPTRPVTQALFRPNVSHDYDDGLADMLDVIGQNYRENEILAAHDAKPTRKIIGTENQHGRTVWLALRDHPAYSGQFLWTGADYLGEGGAWPVTTFSSGLLDRTSEIKPMGYERQSWWSDKPTVHMFRRVAPDQRMVTDPGYEGAANRRRPVYTLFPDWTPTSQEPHQENVEVYSNCAEVELSLNGTSLGSKPLPADASARTWRVDFAPGTLRASCKDSSTTDELRTAGKPAKIVLTVDRRAIRPEWDDLAYVTATVTDAQGNRIPDASTPISFDASGAGRVIAVDNADNTSHEAFQTTRRSAFQGRCVAIARASSAGAITIKASSPGLADGTVSLTAAP